MKRICFMLLVLMASIAVHAQSINGRLVDKDGAPVDGANVVLQKSDSTFVDVVLSDSAGIFVFAHRMDSFRIVVHHLAFHSRELECFSPTVGDVVLEQQANYLGELEIVAERPLVRVDEGRLVYDLAQLVEGKVANNTYEALTKLPGVREDQQQLTLAGAASLTVIIDGKPSTMTYDQLMTLLRSTPIERVEKVEVMYSAPPQYHVRGAAINVVLKKDTQYSLQGELGATYRNKFYNEGAAHAFFRAATPRQAFDVMYSADLVSEVQDIDMLSMHTLGGVVHEIRQLQEIRGQVWLHNARASYEYSFNDKNNVSLAYTGLFKANGESTSRSTGNFQLSESRKTVNGDGMHNVSLRANLGIGLAAGADYTFYETGSQQSMDVDFLNGNVAHLDQKSGQRINVLNVYADQSHSLGKGWKLGYGAKYRGSASHDHQIYSAESTLSGTDVNSSLSEHTAEAYVSVERQLPLGLSFSLSATVEYYRLNDRQRWTVYPQGSLTYMRNPDHIFQASLQMQKLYPSYWQLQDAVSYIDGYSELHNSAALEPSKMYSLNANYILKQKYVFGLFATYNYKMFAQTMYQCSDRLALIYQTLNWDYISQLGMMAVLPYSPVKWFDTRATLVGVYVTQKCDNFFDIGFSNRQLVGMVMLDNSFKVGKGLSFELNGFLQTPATQGTFRIETMWSVSAGAKWNFAGGNGTLSCFYNDIFNSTIGNMKMDYNGQYLLNRNNFYTRNFTLSLTYRFGGYRKKEGSNVDTSRFGH